MRAAFKQNKTMKSKLSKTELLIVIGFILFFFVLAIGWFVQNRKKLFNEWLKLQKEIRDLGYQLRNLSDMVQKQKRNAFILMVFFKFISIILFFCYAQWIHWEFNLNLIASCLGAYSSIAGIYYLIIFLISNKIYSLTEFLQMVHDGLIKLFIKMIKVDTKQLVIITNKIEEKQQQALSIKEKLK